MRATNKYAVDNLTRKRERKTLALDHIRQTPLIHASPFTSYNNINIYILCSKVFQLFRSYDILLYVLELCTFVNYARALLVSFTPRFRAILGSFCPLYGACYGVLARNALHFHLSLTSL